jgi:RNA polymerase sigma factor (sigma-70 family)
MVRIVPRFDLAVGDRVESSESGWIEAAKTDWGMWTMDQICLNQATTWGTHDAHGEAALKPRKPKKYKSDQSPLTPVQQELAEQFLPLARGLARPLKRMFRQWRDDFESAACMALVEAARNFDPSRNIQFATFARFRIRGALNDVGRSMCLSGWEGDHERAPEVHRLTPLNEEFGIVLNSVTDPAVGTDVEAADSVERHLRRIPPRHAEVCRLRYLEGKTLAEVAEVLGVSQSEINRIHRQAMELLTEPYRTHPSGGPVWRRARRSRKSAMAQALVAV